MNRSRRNEAKHSYKKMMNWHVHSYNTCSVTRLSERPLADLGLDRCRCCVFFATHASEFLHVLLKVPIVSGQLTPVRLSS